MLKGTDFVARATPNFCLICICAYYICKGFSLFDASLLNRECALGSPVITCVVATIQLLQPYQGPTDQNHKSTGP